MNRFHSFRSAIEVSQQMVIQAGGEVDPGHWQGVSTEGHPDMVTLECPMDFEVPMPYKYVAHPTSPTDPLTVLRQQIEPNLPWADDHFAERVSRIPSNPGEQYVNWPWWRPQVQAFTFAGGAEVYDKRTEEFQFSHTYQERYWPKEAWLDEHAGYHPTFARVENQGIRYDYGDLDDLVNLLVREPMTRQAYLPIFFPEDTGAVHGGRIPCTLGYHFLFRDSRLHMWYFIRSCDLVRHFRDDLYLSARLLLWVIEECQRRMDNDTAIDDIQPGQFTFVCPSLHVHKGDLHHVKS